MFTKPDNKFFGYIYTSVFNNNLKLFFNDIDINKKNLSLATFYCPTAQAHRNPFYLSLLGIFCWHYELVG